MYQCILKFQKLIKTAQKRAVGLMRQLTQPSSINAKGIFYLINNFISIIFKNYF